jgi:hypothetical protein
LECLGVLTQGLALARQALSRLLLLQPCLLYIIFQIQSLVFALARGSPTYASCVVEITDMNHHTWHVG